MSIEQPKIVISLSHEEALVLFDWLASLEHFTSMPLNGAAERAILWKIGCQLESALPEILAADYGDQLAKARHAVSGK